MLRDDAGDFQSDQNGAGQRDKPGDSPCRQNMSGAAARPSGFHPCLHAEHDGADPKQLSGEPTGKIGLQRSFQGLKKWRGGGCEAGRAAVRAAFESAWNSLTRLGMECDARFACEFAPQNYELSRG